MIVVTAKMKLKSGIKEEFILKSQDLINATRDEEGCLSYRLYSDTDDPNVLIMLEFWKDMDSLDSHSESEHFKNFGNILDQYLDDEIEITKFQAEEI